MLVLMLVHCCCEFSRVIKQYAIRKNDLSNKEKMLQTNRQTLRKDSFRGWSRVYAKQCIGHAANQYSCLTYTPGANYGRLPKLEYRATVGLTLATMGW